MDTTPKYIKMCEEAKKYINKEPELWDWQYDKEYGNVEIIGSLNTEHPLGNKFHKDEIPLYRQDQLQEMVAGNMIAIHLEDTFHEYLKSYYKIPITELDKFVNPTMEQLWLAFAMKEKYNKMWDGEGEEWLKEQ